MAQTVLVQNIALEQAQAQVAQLQQQAQQVRQQPAHATSFLGSLLGHRDPQPQQQQPEYIPPPPPPPQYAQPQYAQPQYVPMGGGPPSFLRGAMQTAAGVAAGALAFEGVEAVLHGLGGYGHPGFGFGGSGFGGPGMMGGGFERPVEENIVNNYYDQPGSGEHHEAGEQHLHESADQSGAQFHDASYNTTGGEDQNLSSQDVNDSSDLDQGSLDQGGFDQGSFDDGGGSGSGFDDGGGGDSGGDLL
jgi:uncharacterized protein